jgi:hypothetical protein
MIVRKKDRQGVSAAHDSAPTERCPNAICSEIG